MTLLTFSSALGQDADIESLVRKEPNKVRSASISNVPREFKCLGKGDLPETFELPVPTTNIDFDSIKPVDLGSN